MPNVQLPDASDSLGEPKSELIDLSPQLRNQRLLEPMNHLHATRNFYQDEDGEPLFNGLDTHYLNQPFPTVRVRFAIIANGAEC